MKKWLLFFVIFAAFLIYFNDGREPLKVKDISIGQCSGLVKIIPMDFREKPYFIKMDDIQKIQEVD